jgi:sRNA-binding protein
MEAMHAYWRRRWPAAFSNPVPLAVGFSGQMKAVLRDEGATFDRKMFGIAVDAWTKQGAYLRAMMRGEMRRNLDGSGAGFPDEASRMEAKRILDERAARQLARAQRDQEAERANTGLGAAA